MTESNSNPTNTALLDAAEDRFAKDGIDRASLRAVMRDAEADPGAIHYHFGGREALAVAVLERVLLPLNERRITLLDAAVSQAKPGSVSLPDLIEAIVRPDVEAAAELDGRGRGRARLIGSIYVDPARFVKATVESHFVPVAQRFMPHLINAVPHVPGPVLSWRVRWFVFGVVGAVMSDGDAPYAFSQDELIKQLVTSASAAIEAQA